MLKTALDEFARFFVQHRNLLVARVQIAAYNLHVLGSSSPSLGV
jgi:hypothetical protein